jgi:hypothetical protein
MPCCLVLCDQAGRAAGEKKAGVSSGPGLLVGRMKGPFTDHAAVNPEGKRRRFVAYTVWFGK